MSQKRNQMLSFWKEVELSARSLPIRMSGHPLSVNDCNRVANAYVLWALVTQDLLGDARTCSDKILRGWVINLCSIDLSDVMSVCKQMLACVRHWSPIMGDQGLGSFKHYLISCDIKPGDQILMPIWQSLYLFCVNYTGFQEINTFLSFISRLTLEDVDWVKSDAIRTYIKYEQTISDFDYNPGILSDLNKIAKERFHHYHVVSYPTHGGGATSTTRRGCGVDTKFSAMQMTWGTHQLERWFDTSHPLIPDDIVSGNDVFTQIQFVPKGIDKKRVISAEPISLLYYQEMLSRSLDDMFRNDHHWNIDLHNQEWNRSLAMEGSRSLNFGTIDLSNASDSVTHSLVSAVMKGIPAFSHWERCRSRFGILPDGSILHLEKYAPMGSALCFPIECIVFSLIVQLACKRCHVDPYFRVYGDDIIVPISIFDEVINLLKELHFEINDTKTFAPGSVFTESCGIECYLGKDVSPVRIPRFYDSEYSNLENRRKSPGRVMGVITFCNHLYDSGLINTRAYIVHWLLESFPEVPFSSDGEIGLRSDTATNFHLKKRWNTDLQRFDYSAISVVTDSDNIDESRHYQLLLERYSHSTRSQLIYPEDRIDLKAGDSHTRLKLRRMCLLDDSVG